MVMLRRSNFTSYHPTCTVTSTNTKTVLPENFSVSEIKIALSVAEYCAGLITFCWPTLTHFYWPIFTHFYWPILKHLYWPTLTHYHLYNINYYSDAFPFSLTPSPGRPFNSYSCETRQMVTSTCASTYYNNLRWKILY